MAAFPRCGKPWFAGLSLQKRKSNVPISTSRLASMLLLALIPPTTSGPPFLPWEGSRFLMHSIMLVSTSFQMSFALFLMQEKQLCVQQSPVCSLTFATLVLLPALSLRPVRSILPSMAGRRDPLAPLSVRQRWWNWLFGLFMSIASSSTSPTMNILPCAMRTVPILIFSRNLGYCVMITIPSPPLNATVNSLLSLEEPYLRDEERRDTEQGDRQHLGFYILDQ